MMDQYGSLLQVNWCIIETITFFFLTMTYRNLYSKLNVQVVDDCNTRSVKKISLQGEIENLLCPGWNELNQELYQTKWTHGDLF